MISDSGKSRAASAGNKPVGACKRLIIRLRMPQALCLPVVPPRRVLSPAMAPQCFQRSLAHPAKLARKMVDLCGWAEKREPGPRLREGPLLGSCLEDLVQVSASGEPREKALLPPVTPQTWDPEAFAAAEKGSKPAAVSHAGSPPQPWASSVSTSPRQLAVLPAVPLPGKSTPARLELERLTRLAGGYRELAALSEALKMRKPEVPGLAALKRFNRTRRRPSRAVEPVHLPWIERAAQRFSRLPVQVQPSGTDAMAETRAVPVEIIAGLQRSWVLLLAGLQAPVSLIRRLAGEALNAGSDRPDGRASEPGMAPSSDQNQRSLLRDQAERNASGSPAWDAPFSQAPRQSAPAPEAAVPTGAQQGFYPQSGSLPLPAAGQPDYRPPLSPPLAAETSPTLLSPQAVFDAPTPYAAARLRQEALKDEADLAGEDLDLLAARIKRILDDEARRHGIAV